MANNVSLIKAAESSTRAGFFLMSRTAMATIIMAITSIITARFLGPELYGQHTLVPMIGLLLNYTPWGIRLTPIVLSLLALTIVFATAAIIRENQAKTSETSIRHLKQSSL